MNMGTFSQNYMLGGYRKKTWVVAAIATCALLLIVPALITQSHAYGNAHAIQEYQVTLSENCNNPAYCVDESGNPALGGFWAWAVLYTDGTFDATTTGCGHSGGPVLDLSPPYGGAMHCNADGNWNTAYNGVEFYILSETDLCSGFGSGKPTSSFTSYSDPGMDTMVPLQQGHYDWQDIFGFAPPPGLSLEITVVSLH